MCVGSSSSAVTVAFGFPVMNGSTRILVSPSISSTADWPRKRMSISSVLLSHELVGQLVPHSDADQHGNAGLFRDERPHGRQALVDVGLAGGLQHRRLVRGAEPVGGLQRLVEDPLDAG